MKKNKKAFTLVELIVVITILAILGTIAFISLQGYGKVARNSVRISDLSSIEKQFELYYQKAGNLPIPDDYITLYASGNIIGYQGFAGKRILDLIGVYNGGKDPLDDEYYTYMTDKNRKNYQIMGFLEDTMLSIVGKQIYAEEEQRTPYVKGKDLGIIVNLNNDPIQKILTTSFDITNTEDTYKAYLDNENILTGTGIELRKASPTYSCDRILSLMRKKITGDYNIDNYYFTGSTDLNVNCDLNLDGLTPIVKTGGGIGDEHIISIQKDNNGNIYVGGNFNSTNFNIFGQTISTNGSIDYFLAKLDNNLNLIWLKNGGGLGIDYITEIKLDNNGNIYVGGYFTSNPSNIFGTTITNNGSNDFFITKLDNNGNLLWVKNGGGISSDVIFTLDLDSDGNIYAGGNISSTNANILGETISTNGSVDYLLIKLNNNGEKIWIKNGGSTLQDSINRINFDGEGYIYIGGYYSGTNTSIFGNNISSSGGYDIYITKLNTDGNSSWIKTGNGTNNETIRDIGLDLEGNIYFGGHFGSENINLFGQNIISNGTYDYYLVKFDKNGNLVWLKNGGGSGNDYINTLKLDSNGNIYIGGLFNNTSNIFGKNINSNGLSDIYIAKIDTNGNLIWLKSGGGSGNDNGQKIELDSNENIYFGGVVSDNTTIFNENLIGNGLTDFFLIKLFK